MMWWRRQTCRGLAIADDLSALVTCETIITMLPDGDVVVGCRPAAGSGCAAMVIDMSSSHPTSAASLTLIWRHAGRCSLMPISGGVGRARTAELMIMAGGSETAFAAARPFSI